LIEQTTLKIKLPIKLFTLACSVIALSWVFEGYRQVSQSPSLSHVALLTTGILLTGFLLWLQAFWIYIEEKSKGKLTKQIIHFDRLQKYLEYQASPIASKKEGGCS
jgi:hypothetical protein